MKVAVIGAGSVGSQIAFTLMIKNLPLDIFLIDINEDLERGNVLDIKDGICFHNTKDINCLNLDDKRISEIDIFIITAGLPMKKGETRIDIYQKNKKIMDEILETISKNMSKKSIFIIVSNPVDLLTKFAIDKLNISKNRIIGTGTVLDSSRMKWNVSKELSIHAKNVQGFVLGEHGDSEFIAWSTVSIGCNGAKNILDIKTMEKIENRVRNEAYEISNYKKSTFFGIATATEKIVSSICNDENLILPVSVNINNFDIHNCNLGFPCVINKEGISKKWNLELEKSEIEKLQISAEKLNKIF